MNCWTVSWLLGAIMLLLQVSKGSIFSQELLICLVSWGMRGSTSMFSKFIFLIPTWLPVHPIVILACHGFLVSLSCQNRLSSGWYVYLCTIELCFYNFTSIGNPQLFPAAKIVLECIALVFVCLYHWLCSKVTFCVTFHNSFVYHIGIFLSFWMSLVYIWFDLSFIFFFSFLLRSYVILISQSSSCLQVIWLVYTYTWPEVLPSFFNREAFT